MVLKRGFVDTKAGSQLTSPDLMRAILSKESREREKADAKYMKSVTSESKLALESPISCLFLLAVRPWYDAERKKCVQNIDQKEIFHLFLSSVPLLEQPLCSVVLGLRMFREWILHLHFCFCQYFYEHLGLHLPLRYDLPYRRHRWQVCRRRNGCPHRRCFNPATRATPCEPPEIDP